MSVILGLASLLVGAIIGASGVGGVLLIPALMFFGGLDTHQAMATALFSFLFTGILATYSFQRHGSIDWKITLPVCAGSFVSSYLGALVGSHASATVLNLLLAALIIGSSLYSMLPRSSTALAARLDERPRLFLLLGIGLFTGFLCGMTGAGGGIVSLPIMLVCGFPALASIGTGQVLQSIVSISGSVSNYANDFIVFPLVWAVTACELVGVAIGVRVAHALPVATIKRLVTWLCLAIGIFVALKSFI